jgi:hypothetical protein
VLKQSLKHDLYLAGCKLTCLCQVVAGGGNAAGTAHTQWLLLTLQAELAAAQADGEKVIGLQQQLLQAQEQAATLRTQLAAAEQDGAAEVAELQMEIRQVGRLHKAACGAAGVVPISCQTDLAW